MTEETEREEGRNKGKYVRLEMKAEDCGTQSRLCNIKMYKIL